MKEIVVLDVNEPATLQANIEKFIQISAEEQGWRLFGQKAVRKHVSSTG